MDWLERTAKLRQWSRSGSRAPHKPLLFLYALGRFQQDADGELRYGAVEEDLQRPLTEYGPPTRRSEQVKRHPQRDYRFGPLIQMPSMTTAPVWITGRIAWPPR
ncbi:hypothetical protein SAMN06272771_4314 [Streptomyces sp. Ag82_O1-12]|nr:hypothetical protein SAMN06272771_4314 [Streptomyces sp. Ag82_O1-12]SOD46920.1 hypothetical protein SAMN06272727_4313 [Streptomyces sp. Ag82_G6-1]